LLAVDDPPDAVHTQIKAFTLRAAPAFHVLMIIEIFLPTLAPAHESIRSCPITAPLIALTRVLSFLLCRNP